MERDILPYLVGCFIIGYLWGMMYRSIGQTPSILEGFVLCVILAALYLLLAYLVRHGNK